MVNTRRVGRSPLTRVGIPALVVLCGAGVFVAAGEASTGGPGSPSTVTVAMAAPGGPHDPPDPFWCRFIRACHGGGGQQ